MRSSTRLLNLSKCVRRCAVVFIPRSVTIRTWPIARNGIDRGYPSDFLHCKPRLRRPFAPFRQKRAKDGG